MFWHPFTQRRPSLRSLLRTSVLSLLMTAAFTGSTAYAGDDFYCGNQFVGVGQVCYGAAHTLTGNKATNQGAGAGCAGAYNYGSYYCADPTGCHTYAAVYILTPGIRHRSTTTGRYMSGEETYGSTPVGANCVTGTPYEVTGPLDAASSELDGVPVLERSKTTAPDAVAALVPNADPDAARTFRTSHGKAWVLVDPSTRSVCLVADDNGTGYGLSCQRYGDARDRGTIATFEDDDVKTAAGDLVIALMPEGVDHVTIDGADGASRTVDASGGVVVTTLAAADQSVTLDASPHADQKVAATKESLAAPTRKAKHRRG